MQSNKEEEKSFEQAKQSFKQQALSHYPNLLEYEYRPDLKKKEKQSQKTSVVPNVFNMSLNHSGDESSFHIETQNIKQAALSHLEKVSLICDKIVWDYAQWFKESVVTADFIYERTPFVQDFLELFG